MALHEALIEIPKGLVPVGSANYLLGVKDGGRSLEYKKLIAGSNVTITHGAGSITIAASGGGGSISGLTSGRIPYANSGTTITDSANLVWDNTNAIIKTKKLYLDSNTGYTDRGARLTLADDTATSPGSMRSSHYTLITNVTGDGVHNYGAIGHYTSVRQHASNALSSGVCHVYSLYANQENNPYNSAFDWTGVVIDNSGTCVATEAVYIGRATAPGVSTTAFNPQGYAFWNGVATEEKIQIHFKASGSGNVGFDTTGLTMVGTTPFAFKSSFTQLSAFGTLGINTTAPTPSNNASSHVVHIAESNATYTPELKIENTANDSAADINLYGKSGSTVIRGRFVVSQGGEVDIGSISNHQLTFLVNNSAAVNISTSKYFLHNTTTANAFLYSVQPVITTGSPTAFRVDGGAHTTLTASTESIGANFNFSATKQFSTGAITTQREVLFQAPTYGFVGASTITNAATVAISGSPVAGTNATITNKYALWAQAGNVRFDGNVGIGVAPIDVFHIQSTALQQEYLDMYSSTASSRHIINFRKSGGTPSSQSAVSNNDELGSIYTSAWNGSAWVVAARMQWRAGTAGGSGGTVSSTSMPSNFRILTTPDGSNSLAVRLEISKDGDVGINTGTASASCHVGQVVKTTGSPTTFLVSGAAHTTLTASAEAVDVNFNLARTVQFASGALALQRAMLVQAPTYGFSGASTLSLAFTMEINGAPAAGTNATITAKAGARIIGGLVLGSAALATNATTGFLYIPSCAGTPSGTPEAHTGTVAMVYDTTNNKLCVYNGAWKQTAALT